MAEERNIFNTTSLIFPLEFLPQRDEAFTVDGRTRAHTHTHTHTRTHTHTPTHTYDSSKWVKLQIIFRVTKRVTRIHISYSKLLKQYTQNFVNTPFVTWVSHQIIEKINRQMKNGSKMKVKNRRKIKEKSRNGVKIWVALKPAPNSSSDFYWRCVLQWVSSLNTSFFPWLILFWKYLMKKLRRTWKQIYNFTKNSWYFSFLLHA